MNSFNEKEWKEICNISLDSKFCNEAYQPFSEETSRKFGVDGFTKSATTVFLNLHCDSAQEATTFQKDSISLGIEKLSKNQDDLKKILNEEKIKKMILITFKTPSVEVLEFCSLKEKDCHDFDIFEEDFKILAVGFTYIKHHAEKAMNALPVKINILPTLKEYTPKLKGDIESELLCNLNRKLKFLYKEERVLKRFEERHIVDYTNGKTILEELEDKSPSFHEKFLNVIETYESHFEESCLLNDAGIKKLYKDIQGEIVEKLKENFDGEFQGTFIENLKKYVVSFWLMHCPIDFYE